MSLGNLLLNSFVCASGSGDSARRAGRSIPRSPSIFKLQSASSLAITSPLPRAQRSFPPSFRPCGNRSACAERNPSSSFVTLSAEDGANALCLLSRFTRKCTCQRNGRYVTCWPMCFPRIVGEVFLNDANDSDRAHSTGHAGHPVPSWDTEQLLMHQEAISEAFHPAQTGSITLDAGSVRVPFTVYAGTDL